MTWNANLQRNTVEPLNLFLVGHAAIGHIASIVRYPVKSMGGESLNHASLTLAELEGDRLYAF